MSLGQLIDDWDTLRHSFLDENGKAAEAELNGVNLGEMNKKLLKKVEELTLYLIEQENKNTATTDLVKALEQRLLNLEERSLTNK